MLKRYLSSAPLGLAIMVGLLYAMHWLVRTGELIVNPPAPRTPIGLTQVRDEIPPVVDKLPAPPDPPVLPPAHTPPTHTETGPPIHVPAPPTDPGPLNGCCAFDGSILADGPLVHAVLVQPQYPPPAEARGLEGYVIVSFDVLPNGTVTNVMALESSHRLFEPAAIRAAKKFRFKPKVVDGTPVESTGVSYRFRFEMEN